MWIAGHLRWAVPSLAVFALIGCGGDDDAGTPTGSDEGGGGVLFVLTVEQGTLEPAGGEQASLSLDVTGSRGVAFTDRPEREATSFQVGALVNGWGKLGFADEPPNAALVLNEAPLDADTTIFEITDPSFDPETEVLTFTATRIEEVEAETLPDHEVSDPPAEFGRADLFVDPGAPVAVVELAPVFLFRPSEFEPVPPDD